jgi:hypothetical protein
MTRQTVSLNYQPRHWAAQVHELMARKRFTVVLAHRRAGKTWVACAALCLSALAQPRTRYAYVAPTRVQGKSITWAIFKTLLEHIPGIVFKEAELTVTFPNGSEIALHSGEHHDSMRGLGLHGVVVDEVANSPMEAWYSSLRPTLSGTNGWALFIGTPRGSDLLSELHQYASSGADPDWAAMSFPAWPENTTGVLSEKEIEAARREAISEGTFLREYGVRLDISAEDQLVRLEDVLACQKRVVTRQLMGSAVMRREARIIGVDLSGPGASGDNSVIVMRQGPAVFEPIIVPSDQYELLPGKVANAIREFEADACFLDGTGGWSLGLIPALQDMGFTTHPINFGSGALKDTIYANRRAEMYALMAEWTRRPNSVLPSGQKLASDLTATRFAHDPKGRMLLEKKVQTRGRLGRSPDIADALALTFAMPVVAPEERYRIPSPRQDGMARYQSDYRRRDPVHTTANRDYDPFTGRYVD